MPRDKTSLELFVTHRGELVDYASGIVGNRAHGEEVVQEAWLRFDGATGRRFIEEPLSYLYRIVRNIALDGRRSQARERRYVTPADDKSVESAPADRPSPETEMVHRQQLALVREALADMPEKTRIALEMHRLEGRKLREIAVRLDISVTQAHGLIAEGVRLCRLRLRNRS